MKKYLIIVITVFAIAPIFISCSGKGNAEAASAEELKKTGEGEHEDEHENTNTTTLSDAQLKSIGIELGGIEQKQLTASLKANGVLKVPNQNKASVNSVYNGVIKSLLVQPGSRVSKGQVIATVTNPEFVQVQSDYLNVSAKIGLAELEVKRQKELNAGNAGALKNLQAAETELSTLRTAKSTYEQQILLMGINPAHLSNGKLISVLSVKSPISGEVSDVKVEMGSYVDFSTAVASIVDNSRLHLDLFVYEKDIPKLKNNQLIHFTLTNNPGKEYDAQIYSLGSSFEGESKAVTVHAKVQGDKTGLIDGMTITAAISLNRESKPAVPTDAIVTVAGQDYIFMVTDEHAEPALPAGGEEHHEEEKARPNASPKESFWRGSSGRGLTFEKIPVVKGITDVGYTEITLLKAIPKDAKIVVKGAFFVLAKMANAGEGEHGH